MILNKKILGGCCVGLALLLSGEGFSMNEFTVKYEGDRSKVVGKKAFIKAYEALKRSREFQSLDDGTKASTVLTLGLLDSGFDHVQVPGYDPMDKVGIIKLVKDSKNCDFLNYYDPLFKLEDEVMRIVVELMEEDRMLFF